MICLYVAIGILLYVELYSAGVYAVAKKMAHEKPWKNFIPFYAFRTVGSVTMGFSVMMIPVRKTATTMIVSSVAALAACAYGAWGKTHLPDVSSASLWQIMLVIIGLCAALFYFCILVSSRKVYRRFCVKHEGLYLLLSVPLVTVPVLYLLVSRNSPRPDAEMY